MIEPADAPSKFQRANMSIEEVQKQNLLLSRKVFALNREKEQLEMVVKQQNMLMM